MITASVKQKPWGLKEQAENLFECLGMNIGAALTVFLRKSVEEEGFPFPVSTRRVFFRNGHNDIGITDALENTATNEVPLNLRAMSLICA